MSESGMGYRRGDDTVGPDDPSVHRIGRDAGEEQTPRDLMLSDFARAAEVIGSNPHLLKTYRRRRASARARYWFPAHALKGAS